MIFRLSTQHRELHELQTCGRAAKIRAKIQTARSPLANEIVDSKRNSFHAYQQVVSDPSLKPEVRARAGRVGRSAGKNLLAMLALSTWPVSHAFVSTCLVSN
jgi:hypothetical protein